VFLTGSNLLWERQELQVEEVPSQVLQLASHGSHKLPTFTLILGGHVFKQVDWKNNGFCPDVKQEVHV